MEPPLEFLHLGGDRRRIGGVAFEHFHRDRPTLAIAQQTIDDLRPIGPVIPAVSVVCQFAMPAFEVG